MSGSAFPSSRFELAPSPGLAAALICAHSVAAASVLAVVGGIAAYALAGSLVALGTATAWSRALLRSRGSVRAMVVEDGAVFLEFPGGARCIAEVVARCYVTRLMVVLAVARPSRRTVLITSDMMEPGSFRRLRLWALWRRLPLGPETGFVAPEQLRARVTA